MAEKECHVYELRNRDGNTVCTSTLPMLGCSREKLLRIIADGYQYKVDGRRWKDCKDELPEFYEIVLIVRFTLWAAGGRARDIAWREPAVTRPGGYYWSGVSRDYSADSVTHWMPLPDFPPVDEKEEQTMEDKFFETLDRLGTKVPDEAKESEEQKATWRISVYLYNGERYTLECSEAQRKAFVERFTAVDDEAIVPAEHSGGVAYVKKGDVIFLNVEPEE